jgi:hypothetical protein
MGAGLLAGGGGGVLAYFALSDNAAANETPKSDPARASHRNSALLKGAIADGLVGAGLVGVGVGAGLLLTRTGNE